MDTRLLLISHASTAAMRAARFPADDPLDARGLAEAQTARARLPIPDDAAARVSPAICARETAAALRLSATVDAALEDLGYGHWQGRRLVDLSAETPQELAAWTRDPDARAPGGESFSELVVRIGHWLDAVESVFEQTPSVVAVTHAAVIRAAIVHTLGASPGVFSRIEIAPLSLVELRRSRRGWTWWPAGQ
ncbi:histidine phosphatase family protein [Paraburkholderia sp. PREW-6R]|uniref:histidine phosphatase family protein n=1 Tax=Paraburkholderia sp. PREW-6R TaxID=3141544 RepID=UPI0031F4EB23